ncbi:MAG TPA: hypothetical protein VIN08_11395 [Ohtaekwangia sp.]|uniref:hypothetical protein n=1 Tax=Ohtaekwangia sp. TaxID=2066019 RepID=UPI002F941269
MNTELHQVFRLPIFFEHYFEHKQQNSHISMLSFIVMHYFSGDVRDSDYERDQQLPFKHAHCCVELSGISLAVPTECFTELVARFSVLARKNVIHQPVFCSSSFQFSIWQPPRA